MRLCGFFKNKDNFVDVVRCKDCTKSFKKNENTQFGICWCGKWQNVMRVGDYCSFGERRR